MEILVIGLGTIGSAVLKEIDKLKVPGDIVVGTDINQDILHKLSMNGYNTSKTITTPDVYIICVYTAQQVKDVINDILASDYKQNSLICIESTIDPNMFEYIYNIEFNGHIVTCPHRLNPEDRDHWVFNIHRILGGRTPGETIKGFEFYRRFMDANLLHLTDFNTASLTKIIENAYRFLEIAFAEELKLELCDKNFIYDFDELRALMNTKWNIDIKEARNGIGGVCLPKEIRIINNFINSEILKSAFDADAKYIKMIEKEKEVK